MGCIKLSILDERYKRTELKITRSRKELTFIFCGGEVRSSFFNAKEYDELTGTYYYGARYYDPSKCTYNSRDKYFEKQHFMSPYAQCNNDPINRIDPDGNWSKPVHHKMVNIAVREMVRDGELKISKSEANAMIKGMQKGSDKADGFFNGNQKTENSHIHYMRDPKISVEKAKENAQNFVKENIADFKKTGNYESLGQAAHTMMDATCPAHVDKNGDPRTNELGASPRKWMEHLEGDNNLTSEYGKVHLLNKGVSNVKAVIREGMKNNPNQEQGKEAGLIDP